MNIIKCVCLFCLLVCSLTAQQKINKQVIEYRLNQYLDFNGSLSKLIKVSNTDIQLYSTENNLNKKNPSITIGFDEIDFFNLLINQLPFDSTVLLLKNKKNNRWTDVERDNYFSKYSIQKKDASTTKKLSGKKIAIDPGHIAGNHAMAFIEGKNLKFTKKKYPELKQDSILIAEGILTYATTLILKMQLENEGAEVFITRSENKTAFGITYDEWISKRKNNYLDSLFAIGKISLSKKEALKKKNTKDFFYDFFKDIDLVKRAEQINKFKPDVTIIIHYNVDEKNKNWEKPTNKNYCMAFIPGALDAKVLQTDSGRINLLRLLLTNHLPLSEKLAALTVNEFSKQLNVPVALKTDAEYLFKNCKSSTKPGIYSRNLALCRLIQSPLVYGESLYQDNVNEYEELSKQNSVYYGINTNKRVKQVADAYFNAVMNFFNE
jgi:N-acetylmuramoyl-L-alanine amidase